MPKSAPADKIGLTLMPFPSGKGQANTPKNYHNRGKVPTPNPSPVSPEGEKLKTIPTQNIDHAQVRASGQDRTHPHALSFRKGAIQHAENSPQSGKGHSPSPPLPLPSPVWIDSPIVIFHAMPPTTTPLTRVINL